MSNSKLQDNCANVVVAFQGSTGSFSESALMQFFNTDTKRIACEDFEKVFSLVSNNECDFGIVPIENSLIGTIYACFDKFLLYKDISIVGHTQIQIEHALIGLPNAKVSDVKTVYSQLPGLEQCTYFLSQNKMTVVPFRDTAAAVGHVAKEKDITKAAIASERAAKVYDLQVLVKNIENNSQNFTRFAVIKKQKAEITRLKEISKEQQFHNGFVIFSTSDTPGALLECLKIFSSHNVNLHKIESRPIIGKPWEYQFVAEIDARDENSKVLLALEKLLNATQSLHIVGLYPR